MLNNKGYDERMLALIPYIQKKSILDIGCYAEIKELIKEDNKPKWIHGFLRKYSNDVTGIDLEKDKIEILKKQGYNVYHKNAEDFKFNKRFDVIFAGDVIEHLSNPGMFLDTSFNHLKKNGRLIITTPNVFCLNYKLGGIIRLLNNDLEVHPQHTMWFSPKVIKSLLNRHNFEVIEVKFVNFHNPDTPKRFVQNLLCRIINKKLKYTMMVVAKPRINL